jgi:lipopolysaccharide biosynthesis regulator YciM
MAFRWLAIVILILAVFVLYLATLNAVPVKVALPFLGEFNPTSGLLMILSFAVGIITAILFFAVRDWQDYFRRLAAGKKEKLSLAAREKLTRARNWLRLDMTDLAQGALREAIEKDPGLAEAHEATGDILFGRGDYYGAAASHNQALTLDRDNDALRWKLALDYRCAGNLTMAIQVFKDGLAINDRNVFLLIKYRDFLVDLKDWDGAIAQQARLVKSKEYRAQQDHRSLLAGLHLEKGKHLLSLTQNEEAIKSLEEATKIDPMLAPAWVRTGDAYLAIDKEKNALKFWALGYRKTSDLSILSRLEDYYLRKNDPSRIINLYLRYIDEKPEDVSLRFQFASLLYKLEMLQEAQNQVEEIRRLQGEDNPRVAYLSYHLKEKTDDLAGALNDLKFLVENHLPAIREQVCSACRRTANEPLERCPSCGRWGSFRPTS